MYRLRAIVVLANLWLDDYSFGNEDWLVLVNRHIHIIDGVITFMGYFLNGLLMDSYCVALQHGWWNTEGVWWILGFASHCSLKAKKLFSRPVVIHQDGVVWGVAMEVTLNDCLFPWALARTHVGYFFFPCPEGKTHQSDVRVNIESDALENQIRI